MITREWKQAVYEPSEGNVAFRAKRKTRGGEKIKLYFSAPFVFPFTLVSKCRVHLVWFIKRLFLCRLERKQDCQQ